jgi:hypothetical protein
MRLVSCAAFALAVLALVSCSSEKERPKKDGFTFAPASAFPKPDRVCEFGADRTCNDDPAISSIHGTCNQDGTCTCRPGFERRADTGKCK